MSPVNCSTNVLRVKIQSISMTNFRSNSHKLQVKFRSKSAGFTRSIEGYSSNHRHFLQSYCYTSEHNAGYINRALIVRSLMGPMGENKHQ